MPSRNFTDRNGIAWTAWDVVPGQLTVHSGDVRRHLPDAMADGWLCFESRAGKRRLNRIPEGWAELSDEELAALAEEATPARRAPALRSAR